MHKNNVFVTHIMCLLFSLYYIYISKGDDCWHGDIRVASGTDIWVDSCHSCYCPETTQYRGNNGYRTAMCYKHTDCDDVER